jgi:hypothetical protein
MQRRPTTSISATRVLESLACLINHSNRPSETHVSSGIRLTMSCGNDIKHDCLLHMGFTDYIMDSQKTKLLIYTIKAVCNRIHEDPSQDGRSPTPQFFRSAEFVNFKTKIIAADKETDIVQMRKTASEAIHIWRFGLNFIGTLFEDLSQYVLLLRDILYNFNHHFNDIWRKNDGAFMLYNLTPDRFFKREGDLKPLLLRMNALCARQYEDVV